MTDPNQTRRLMSSETFIKSALGFIPQEQDSPFTLPSEADQEAERLEAVWTSLTPWTG